MVLRAYFDEGGTHQGSPFTCLAGYLFQPEKDAGFPGQWGAAEAQKLAPPGGWEDPAMNETSDF